MQQVSANDIIRYIGSLAGQEFRTAKRNQAFTVRLMGDGVEYTPLSTGKPRGHNYKWLARVCDEFSRTNSFKPVDYQHLSVNASYALAVIAKYLQAHSQIA